jgi:hypothetical protein
MSFPLNKLLLAEIKWNDPSVVALIGAAATIIAAVIALLTPLIGLKKKRAGSDEIEKGGNPVKPSEDSGQLSGKWAEITEPEYGIFITTLRPAT